MEAQKQLMGYLKDTMGIPVKSLEIAARACDTFVDSLPIVLWQYGLIDLSQLNQIFDWLETV